MKEKSVKILYMIPEVLNEKTLRPYRWKEVSIKEFKEEWRKNGLFEYVDSRYRIGGDMILYISYKKGCEKGINNKGIEKVDWI